MSAPRSVRSRHINDGAQSIEVHFHVAQLDSLDSLSFQVGLVLLKCQFVFIPDVSLLGILDLRRGRILWAKVVNVHLA